MKNAKWITALAFAFIVVLLNAQQREWCGTMPLVNAAANNDPSFATRYEAFRDLMRNEEIKAASRGNTANFDVVFIPVVFHVVYNNDAIGTGENISDAQLLSQIDVWNTFYNFKGGEIPGLPAEFKSVAADCKIKFCMAQTDPLGQPTTGIVRHKFPYTSWGSERDIDSVLKPATIWDPRYYLNVWSVNMGGGLVTEGLLGYATLPFATTPQTDGVVAKYSAIGTIGAVNVGTASGKTLCHEVGHWLGLLHIWGDDGTKCATDTGGGSDFIDDTPDQASQNFGCPSFPHVSCNNGPNGDLYVDFMDYTQDGCGGIFTRGQAERMHFMLDTYRPLMKNALTSCFYDVDADIDELLLPRDTLCSLGFQPTINFKNLGIVTLQSGKFYYMIDSGTIQITDWTGPLATGEAVRVSLPEISLAQGKHNFDITFVPNGIAADDFLANNNKNISFYAYNSGTATALPFSEAFESASMPANWQIDNSNNDAITWEINAAVGAYGLSNSSISINNKGYVSNPGKRRDGLITDNYDFTSPAFPELSFDVAYARFSDARYDSLNVYYSLDCGRTFTKLWSSGGTQLATARDTAAVFIPATDQWKTISVPLWKLIGLKKVSLKFENVTGWGNELYLDNINVHNNPNMVSVKEVPKDDVKVFPNPASNMLAVRLPFDHTYKELQLLNNIGQPVYRQSITDNAIIIPVNELPTGLYLLHLQGDKKMQVEKVLITH